jgi:hypothetical protein
MEAHAPRPARISAWTGSAAAEANSAGASAEIAGTTPGTPRQVSPHSGDGSTWTPAGAGGVFVQQQRAAREHCILQDSSGRYRAASGESEHRNSQIAIKDLRLGRRRDMRAA